MEKENLENILMKHNEKSLAKIAILMILRGMDNVSIEEQIKILEDIILDYKEEQKKLSLKWLKENL